MPRKQESSELLLVRHNRLVIIEDLGIPESGGGRKVIALCDCGVKKEFFMSSIKNGNSKSCGCIKIERAEEWKKKHGLSNHPIYTLWVAIKQRCYNIESTNFYNYGLIGVRMCDEWKDNFEAFYDWCTKNGWREDLEIDKDKLAPSIPGKLYSPEYCCFLTKAENRKYSRQSNFIEYGGIVKTLKEWAIELKLNYSAINKRLVRGWDPKLAFETPIISNGYKK